MFTTTANFDVVVYSYIHHNGGYTPPVFLQYRNPDTVALIAAGKAGQLAAEQASRQLCNKRLMQTPPLTPSYHSQCESTCTNIQSKHSAFGTSWSWSCSYIILCLWTVCSRSWDRNSWCCGGMYYQFHFLWRQPYIMPAQQQQNSPGTSVRHAKLKPRT